MKKLIFIIALVISGLLTMTVPASANGQNHNNDNNHRRCSERRPPHFDKTVISGTIFNGNGDPIGGENQEAEVTVICNGKTRKTKINDNGSYEVFFPKNLCKEGDTVTVSVVTEEGTGSKTDTVFDDPAEGTCGDLNIAVIDITVPEFGFIGGTLTGISSIAGYLYLRAKQII